jgi:acyl-coenzyme A synthetase/AMP-(fatty) acid ligase
LAQVGTTAKVTLINTVPSALAALVASHGIPASVRCINLAGEPLSAALVRKIEEQAPGVRVMDLYGPTETATYSTFAQRKGSEPATIGRPLANTMIFVLDSRLQPLPPGVPGQLFIGGEGVARGYLHQPELTSERFVNLAHLPSAGRVYQTGDLVRYRQDGNLEYMGRMDQQVKIRGFRIELEEIESVLLKHSRISEAIVVVHQDDVLGSSLAACLVAKGGSPDTTELVAFQRKFLPEYMIVSKIMFLDRLPLTPSGKVDRKLLSGMRMKSVETGHDQTAALTEVERELTRIWEKHFKNKSIGVNDDFFALGGQSLLALQIFREIEKKLNVSLMLSLLLKAPTIRLLAAEITQRS